MDLTGLDYDDAMEGMDYLRDYGYAREHYVLTGCGKKLKEMMGEAP